MLRIDDFPRLCESLGKPRTDRIRDFLCNKQDIGGPRTRWTPNPFHEYLEGLGTLRASSVADDVFTGAARTEQSSATPLNADRLFNLLACNKRVSSDLIRETMNIDDRQARRYMAAAKLAIFVLSKRLSAPEPVKRSLTLAEIRSAFKTI